MRKLTLLPPVHSHSIHFKRWQLHPLPSFPKSFISKPCSTKTADLRVLIWTQQPPAKAQHKPNGLSTLAPPSTTTTVSCCSTPNAGCLLSVTWMMVAVPPAAAATRATPAAVAVTQVARSVGTQPFQIRRVRPWIVCSSSLGRTG